MQPILFIIDESPAIHRLIEQISLEEGFTVQTFTDGPTAIEEARTYPPDIIIADYHLEGLTFTTFCDKLGEQNIIPTSYLILLSGTTDRYDESSMLTRGVQGFLHKPLQPEHLTEMFEEFYEAQKDRERKQSKKAKSWPPETTMTDLEDPFLLEDLENEGEPILLEIIQPELPQSPVSEKPKNIRASTQAEEKNHSTSPSPSQEAKSVKSPNEEIEKPDHSKDVPVTLSQDKMMEPPIALKKPPPSQSVENEKPATFLNEERGQQSKDLEEPTTEHHLPVNPPVISPNLRLAGSFPKLDYKQIAAASTAAAGALLHKKSKQIPTERSPMAQSQGSPNDLPPQLETAMRGFLNQLTQTVGQPTSDQNHQFEELVKHTVAAQLPPLVQEEVATQLSSALDEEHLKRLVQTVVQDLLPNLIAKQVRTIEDSLQETVHRHTQEHIEELAPKLVQDLTDPAVKKYLPEAIKEQSGTVDGLVKETAVELVMPHLHDSIDKVVREEAAGRIEQLVQTLVPDLAESHIKKEIERLTEPEERS